MKFRTEITVPVVRDFLTPVQPVLLLGSCFSDYIGERMRRCRWNAVSNPGGTLFNPISISTQLELAVVFNKTPRKVRDLLKSSIFYTGEYYASWYFDTKFASLSAEECLNKCIEGIRDIAEKILTSGVVVITFGTSFVYSLAAGSNNTVSNCHKQPASMFVRRMLEIDEIVEVYRLLLKKLNDLNPDLRFIFTVSPVRHIKDGLHKNSISKGRLLEAIDELCRDYERYRYFPAYEIMMDDLRDYRFYEADLIHPNGIAVEYIWTKFVETYLSQESKRILEEGEKLRCRESHRFQLEDSDSSLKFKADTAKMIESFKLRFPGMI